MSPSHPEAMRQWLHEQVARQSPGSRLPTAKELARAFGIAEITVKKHFATLRRAKRIHTIRGRGTFCGPAPRLSNQTPAKPESSSDTIARHVEDLIRTGTLKRGDALPAPKSLCYQFRVTTATVTAAYRGLAKRGRVVKVGRTYWVGSFAETVFPAFKKEIAFVYGSPQDLKSVFRSGFMPAAFRRLQDELAFHGFVLRYYPLNTFGALCRNWTRSTAHPYGILLAGATEERARLFAPPLKRYGAALRSAAAQAPRIVVHWNRGNFVSLGEPVVPFVEGHVSTSAARLLARFITAHKFAHVSFFASADDQVWHASWQWTFVKIREEIKRLERSVATRFIVWPGPQDERENLDALRAHLRRTIGEYETSSWAGKSGERAPTSQLLEEFVVAPHAREYFTKPSGGDLWVFARDHDAAQAVQWCRDNRFGVPSRCSIIGLEDDPSYYPHGITSCTPDQETNGYLIAHALIGDFSVARTTKGMIATRAKLVERLTTK
ncbi:MAG: GntR family transcriptional regulator [Chitinivibrionales bacterium]|nr:GntR family transcriptional regulator [Chitinivibrionales bacterium]